MSPLEDQLKRIADLEKMLTAVQTITARGGDYGTVIGLLEILLPDVVSEKITLERARDIERGLTKSKESLTAQEAKCDKREAAFAERQVVSGFHGICGHADSVSNFRERNLDVQVNDQLPAEMRKLQLATDRIEASAASFADSTRDTTSAIADLKAVVESMKNEQATQRQHHDVLERRFAEKERLLADREQRYLERERLLADREQRHLEKERRLAEQEQRHAETEQRHAETETRLLAKESSLSEP
ncbi:MAG: hypothetical protein LQ349_006973 [Xanthoria aureola]|nr:MAG: hypothetical protein LQ349_006973 [Xanthoria aureola]